MTGHDRAVPVPEGWVGGGGSYSHDGRGEYRAEVWRSRNPENELIEWRAQVWSRRTPDSAPLLDEFTGQDLHEAFHLVGEALDAATAAEEVSG